MHILKPYWDKIVYVLTAVILSNFFFFNQTPSCICSMCLHLIGKVSNCSIKSCGRSPSANEGTIYEYTNTFLGKNRLSSHCCHFVKKYFFLNQTPACICSMCLIIQAKYQIVPSKAVVGVDRPMKAPSMHIQKLY